MRALAIAATGMDAQETNVEVIANNIANINTTAFKRSRAEFADLLYQFERLQGVPNRGGENPVPEGARIGLGVRTVAIRNLHMQGSLTTTSNPLDLAINGRGYFEIVGPNGEPLYTRAGSFNRGPEGELVTLDGYQVQPAIFFPDDATEIVVNRSGEIFARIPDEVEPQFLGQLNMVTFANDAGLEPLGDNLFRETVASGAPIDGIAGEDGFGTINQGYLEASNVDPVKEITNLITAQRAYEMNSRVMQVADSMAGTMATGIR